MQRAGLVEEHTSICRWSDARKSN